MTTSCFPLAQGVPALPGAPNWLDAARGRPIDTTTDDPRWRGAFSHTFGAGGPVHVTFRALNFTDASGTKLYLSWLAQVDPLVTAGQDTLFVGFSTGDAAPAIMLRIQIATAVSTEAGGPAVYTPNIFVKPAVGNWLAPTLIPPPAWVTASTRVWINYTPPVSPTLPWGIQMEVPIGVELSPNPANSVILPSAADFKMWYAILLNTAAEPGADVEYHWPGTPAPTVLPAPSSFADCRISTIPADAACAASGITIGVLNIGTKNSDGSDRLISSNIQADLTPISPAHPKIVAPPDNLFFAQPIFPVGTPDSRKQNLSARFRLANWGSYVGDSPSWKAIPGGESVSFDTAQGQCHFIWPTQPELDIPGTDTRKLVDDFRSGARMLHQCMLVELSSSFPGGETFLNNSVYRNMDIVSASRFSREATISIEGIAPISPVQRDVYLYLETRNMPDKVESNPDSGKFESHLTLAFMKRDVAVTDTEGDENASTVDMISRFAPTYFVHVYHDTGLRTTLKPGNPRLLSTQPSFGYFAVHQGELTGWAARLQGAIRIAEKFYYLPILNNGSAKVTTIIQAVEPGEAIEPELPITPQPKAGCSVMGCLKLLVDRLLECFKLFFCKLFRF